MIFRSRQAKALGKCNTSLGTKKLTSSSMRGYQLPPGRTPQRLNKAPFRRLEETNETDDLRNSNSGSQAMNDQESRKTESKEVPLIGPETNALDLEDLGFANLYIEN